MKFIRKSYSYCICSHCKSQTSPFSLPYKQMLTIRKNIYFLLSALAKMILLILLALHPWLSLSSLCQWKWSRGLRTAFLHPDNSQDIKPTLLHTEEWVGGSPELGEVYAPKEGQVLIPPHPSPCCIIPLYWACFEVWETNISKPKVCPYIQSFHLLTLQ